MFCVLSHWGSSAAGVTMIRAGPSRVSADHASLSQSPPTLVTVWVSECWLPATTSTTQVILVDTTHQSWRSIIWSQSNHDDVTVLYLQQKRCESFITTQILWIGSVVCWCFSGVGEVFFINFDKLHLVSLTEHLNVVGSSSPYAPQVDDADVNHTENQIQWKQLIYHWNGSWLIDTDLRV